MSTNPSEGRTLLDVWIQPKAAKDEVVGFYDNALKVRVTAPPVEGKANKQLIKILSERLGVPAGRIHLRSGRTGRRKTVEIVGVSRDEINRRLSGGPS